MGTELRSLAHIAYGREAYELDMEHWTEQYLKVHCRQTCSTSALAVYLIKMMSLDTLIIFLLASNLVVLPLNCAIRVPSIRQIEYEF